MPGTVALSITLVLALVPALVGWWGGRQVLERVDDPALPELLLAQRQRLTAVTFGGLILLAIVGGQQLVWALPLLAVALLLSRYPLRRALFDERWSAPEYLRYAFFSFVGGVGYWILLGATPSIVLAIVRNSVGDDPRALGLTIFLGALFGLILLVWQHRYAQVWLALHRATPVRLHARAELLERLDGVLDRAGLVLARRPTVWRYGAPGAHVMNAVAIPSLSTPAVAMGDTLLATLTDDEIVAVFAHEVSHHEQFTRRRLYLARVSGWVLTLLAASMPALLVSSLPVGTASTAGWWCPLVLGMVIVTRLRKSRQHETESDLRAAELTGNASAVSSALQKLHRYSRLPRRWPHEFERAATHPSLARRIQAIEQRAAAPASTLAAPTCVRSREPGRVVALDVGHAYWFEGIPADTPLDLATLRERATSFRAIAYADLTELRVVVRGHERLLMATDRAGGRWTMQIAREDVQVVQTALDVVDTRLGSATSAAAPDPQVRFISRLLAVALLLALMMAGQPGIGFVTAIVLLVWPSPASIAAAGAVGVTSPLVAIAGATPFIALERIGAFAAVAIGLALAVIAVRRVRVAVRVSMASALDAGREWKSARPAVIAHGIMALGLLLVLLPAGVASPGALATHPLLPTFATATIALGAAAATLRRRTWRMSGYSTLAAGVAVGVLAVGDGRLTAHTPPLAWSEATVKPNAVVPIAGNAAGLSISPGGEYFALHQYLPVRRPGGSETNRFLVGRFDAANNTSPRALEAWDALFLDNRTLAVLADAGPDSLELRLDQMVPNGAIGPAIWRKRIAMLVAPKLAIDRTRRSWIVMSAGEADGAVVVLAGSFDNDSVLVRRWRDSSDVSGEMPGHPIAAFSDGSALELSIARSTSGSSMPLWLSVLSVGLQWEVSAVDHDHRRLVAEIARFPSCGNVMRSDHVLCWAMDRNPTRVWRASRGTLELVADLPRYDLIDADGAEQLVVASRYDSRLALVDLAAHHGIRLRLPDERPSRGDHWLSDVATSDSVIATITRSGNSSILTRYPKPRIALQGAR